jgi:hypothetical protein
MQFIRSRKCGCVLALALSVKGFGCRPLTSVATATGGRRPKGSREETAMAERLSVLGPMGMETNHA